MSRVKYAYANTQGAAPSQATGIRAHVHLSEKIRDRGWLRSSFEAVGLFLFGFGVSGLLLHVASGFFFVSAGAHFLPHLYI